MAWKEQYGMRGAIWHGRSNMAWEEQYGMGGAIWHGRNNMAWEEQYGMGAVHKVCTQKKKMEILPPLPLLQGVLFLTPP